MFIQNTCSVARLTTMRYRVIACVRNPWDILVSWYHHNKNWFGPKFTEFPDFIRRFPVDRKNVYLENGRMFEMYTKHASHIIHFESQRQDLARILHVPIPLPHIGASDRRPYQSYYDESSREFVAERFSYEIERYGYRFEGE